MIIGNRRGRQLVKTYSNIYLKISSTCVYANHMNVLKYNDINESMLVASIRIPQLFVHNMEILPVSHNRLMNYTK